MKNSAFVRLLAADLCIVEPLVASQPDTSATAPADTSE